MFFAIDEVSSKLYVCVNSPPVITHAAGINLLIVKILWLVSGSIVLTEDQY